MCVEQWRRDPYCCWSSPTPSLRFWIIPSKQLVADVEPDLGALDCVSSKYVLRDHELNTRSFEAMNDRSADSVLLGGRKRLPAEHGGAPEIGIAGRLLLVVGHRADVKSSDVLRCGEVHKELIAREILVAGIDCIRIQKSVYRQVPAVIEIGESQARFERCQKLAPMFTGAVNGGPLGQIGTKTPIPAAPKKPLPSDHDKSRKWNLRMAAHELAVAPSHGWRKGIASVLRDGGERLKERHAVICTQQPPPGHPDQLDGLAGDDQSLAGRLSLVVDQRCIVEGRARSNVEPRWQRNRNWQPERLAGREQGSNAGLSGFDASARQADREK